MDESRKELQKEGIGTKMGDTDKTTHMLYFVAG